MEDEMMLTKFWQHLEATKKPELAIPEIVSVSEHPVEADPISASLLGGLVGGFAPGIFGASSWIIGALIGASIGYRLGMMLDKKDDKPKKYRSYYTFTGDGGEIAKSGSPLSLVYCNRIANPSGGVRYAGSLIGSYVETNKGSGILRQLYALGIGELGEVSTTDIIVNGQPKSHFYVDEVSLVTRPGLPSTYNATGQAPIAEFPFYSQCVSSQSYATIGNRKVAKTETSNTVSQTTVPAWSNTFTNCYLVEDLITKNTGGSTEYNASALGTSSVQAGFGGVLEFMVISPQVELMVGFTTSTPSTTMPLSVGLNTNGLFQIYEGGVVKHTGATVVVSGDKFTIEIADTNAVVYKLNNVLVYSSTVLPPRPLYPGVVLKTQGAQVKVTSFTTGVNYLTGALQTTTASSTIRLNEEREEDFGGYDSLNPASDYMVVKNSSYFPFKITEKPTTNSDLVVKEVKVSPPVSVSKGDEIYEVWTGKFETTKRVSEVHFNFSAIVFAQPKPEAEGGKK